MRLRAVAAALAATLLCVACSESGTPEAAPTTAPPTTVPPTTAAPTVLPTTAAPTVVPTATATPLPTDLADGRHYAYLRSLDTKGLTLTVDVVQFLTGEEAEKAAADDGEEAHDYYVRNQNTRLRTLTLAAGVRVVVNTLTAEETGSSTKDTAITLAKLASYFANGEAQQRVFHFTLSGGRVTRIDEQYLP